MRSYYNVEDDLMEGEGQTAQRAFLPDERLRMADWLIAAALVVVVFAGMSVFAFPGLLPEVWNDAAAAAGLRPPSDIFPGFWRMIARVFFAGGVSAGEMLLRVSGRACAALTAGMAYLFLRASLALLVRGRLRTSRRRYFVQYVASFLGALFFACSDPAWRSGQTFTPGGLLTFLSVAAITPFAVFMLNGSLACAYSAMFLLGALAAETPLGFVLLALCWIAYRVALTHDALCENMPLLEPLAAQTAKWNLTFFWGVGIAAGVFLNCWSFMKMVGGQALAHGGLPLAYLLRWWAAFTGTADGLGWVLAFILCVLPFSVACVMLPRAVDEENFLPYHVGAVVFICGIVSYSQLAMTPRMWFWTWSPLTAVRSPYFLQMFLLLSACTVTYLFTVLGCDACCRNHVKLSSFRAMDDDVEPLSELPRGKRHGLVVLSVAAVISSAGVIPGRALERTRELLAIVDAFTEEVLRECGNADSIFTDGAFDGRLELGAAARGRRLVALSVMAPDTPYERGLRLRAAVDEEDRTVLSMGAATALRSWQRDRPGRLATTAFQLGFELWRRDGGELPACSGVLARIGMDEKARAEGVEAARSLADRIAAFHAAGGDDGTAGAAAMEKFNLVEWRIARLARVRAGRADRAGDVAAAKAELALADRLDDSNAALRRIVQEAEARRDGMLRQVTPREGLQLALLRADFALASRYAKPILDADPDDPDANFGVGMNFFQNRRWALAADSLERCLRRKSGEPAVFNNLALALMKMGRFEDAEKRAGEALALAPSSAEIKSTVAEIAVARAATKPKTTKDSKPVGRPVPQDAL
jgi:tetratricopeptide (TPR) repeat protein